MNLRVLFGANACCNCCMHWRCRCARARGTKQQEWPAAAQASRDVTKLKEVKKPELSKVYTSVVRPIGSTRETFFFFCARMIDAFCLSFLLRFSLPETAPGDVRRHQSREQVQSVDRVRIGRPNDVVRDALEHRVRSRDRSIDVTPKQKPMRLLLFSMTITTRSPVRRWSFSDSCRCLASTSNCKYDVIIATSNSN
jgi:hypothetical protein